MPIILAKNGNILMDFMIRIFAKEIPIEYMQ